MLSGTATNLCEVPPKDRVDCGYPEISSEQCTNRGCCFDSSIHGVPWCFKPLQDTGKPSHVQGILLGSPEATHAPAGPPTPWLSTGGGLSRRSHAQGRQRPGAVPCCPFAKGFVLTLKAVVWEKVFTVKVLRVYVLLVEKLAWRGVENAQVREAGPVLEATFSNRSTVVRDVLLVGYIVAAPAPSRGASPHPPPSPSPPPPGGHPHPSQ